MVEVSVREYHGGGVQPVLGEQVVQPREHADARVDHDTLLTGRGRHHVAVGAEGVGDERGDEHAPERSRCPVPGFRTWTDTGAEVGRRLCPALWCGTLRRA